MRRTAALAVLALALVLGGTGPASAAHAAQPVAAQPATPAAQDDGEPPTQAAHLAEQLRKNPVYVTDQVPRSVPKSAADRFADIARRTGVPTYVLVLPTSAFSSDPGLLAAVHDHLGEDGLYVLLDENGIYTEVGTYGVEVPAKTADMAAQYELPHDAGALDRFERFVSILTSGEAKKRFDEAQANHDDDRSQRYPGPSDREDQSLLTGLLLSGVPLSVIACACGVWVVNRRRERKDTRNAPASPARSSLRPPLVVGTALLSAGAVAWVCLSTFDADRSDAGPPPTRQDVTARVDRVVAGLAQDPLYIDREFPRVFTAAQEKSLREHIARADVPVFLTSLPMMSEDESEGDGDFLLHRLHQELGRKGLYVNADPHRGRVELRNYGVPLELVETYDLPDHIRARSAASFESGDLALPERLDRFFEHLADVPEGEPGAPSTLYSLPEDPVEEDRLPHLMSTGLFWFALLVLGPIASVMVYGLTIPVALTVGAVRGRRPDRGGTTTPVSVPDAPRSPSAAWLRRTLRTEIDALAALLDASDTAGGKAARRRAWDCLDAARLLVDEDGDHRVDADASPNALTAALTLVRFASRTWEGVSGHVGTWCAVNPLHGPAVGTVPLTLTGGGKLQKTAVCTACRSALTSGPRAERADHARQAMLRVPSQSRRRGGSAVPYHRSVDPVRLFGNRPERLVKEIREYIGVS